MNRLLNARFIAVALVVVVVVIGLILISTGGEDLEGTAGQKQTPPGQQDNDGDGVRNNQDQCPDVAGDAGNNGCPLPPTEPPPPPTEPSQPPTEAAPPPGQQDNDGDGIRNNQDQCPDTPGDAANNGCPPPPPTEPPPTEAAAQPTEPAQAPGQQDRFTICHAAGQLDVPANWVIIRNLPRSAVFGQNGASAHFNEQGTPLAGHEEDFVISGPGYPTRSESECAPPGEPSETPETSRTPPGQQERFTICHAAGRAEDPANWVIIRNLPRSAVFGQNNRSAHFNEQGTPLAGHEQDFIISGPGFPTRSESDCGPSGETPTPETETPTRDRYTICHAAGRAEEPANWVILRDLPRSAVFGQNEASAHFNEQGTPLAGHEQDFIISGPGYPTRPESDCGPSEETPTPTSTPPRNRYTICHVAGRADFPANYVILTLPETAIFGQAGHFNENGTTRAGHEEDFFIVGPPGVETRPASECGAPPTETPTPTNTPTNTPTGTLTETPEESPTPTETPTATPTEPPLECNDVFLDEFGFPQVYSGPECETPPPPEETPPPPPEWVPPPNEPAVCVDWLVYHTDITGDWEIFRLGNLPGGLSGDPNLTRGVGAFDLAPSRSPDNLSIAFTSNRDSNFEIYIATVDGRLIERVTFSDYIDIDPVWSPNGLYIAYESNRNGNWDVYMVDLSTGAELQLTTDEANDLNPFWSPDGSKLVFQSDRDGFWQIYEYVLATGKVNRLSDGTGDDHDPEYSFDGRQLAFRSYRDGDNSVIYVSNADGSDPQPISDPNGDATNHAWSPGDVAIAYQSNLDGDLDIYVYEFESEETRLVTENDDVPDYAPTWICDSTTVVFTSDVTDDPNIFDTSALPITLPAIDVETEARQLTFDLSNDQYPQNAPPEENASRQGALPSPAKNLP